MGCEEEKETRGLEEDHDGVGTLGLRFPEVLQLGLGSPVLNVVILAVGYQQVQELKHHRYHLDNAEYNWEDCQEYLGECSQPVSLLVLEGGVELLEFSGEVGQEDPQEKFKQDGGHGPTGDPLQSVEVLGVEGLVLEQREYFADCRDKGCNFRCEVAKVDQFLVGAEERLHHVLDSCFYVLPKDLHLHQLVQMDL